MPTGGPKGMAQIPGGAFRMGSDMHYPEERPAHLVTVDGFWIDRYAVTNADFAAFIAASVSSTFGGVIATPALDRVAKAGLRYTQFHSTALCSPTRAALITGRNHHSAGFGIIGELSTGYPGYDSIRRTVFTYSGENAGIPVANAPSILDKDYTITAEVTIPEGGAQGMIVTLGGRFGGYGLYLLKGKPVFNYNLLNLQQYRWESGAGARDWLGSALSPGAHTIVFDFKYDGPGPGKGGTGVLSVDGKELARKTIPHTIPLLMSIDETFDIGVDTRTPVDDSYNVPFRFTGKINKLTFNLGPEQLTAAERKAAAEALAIAHD
jgi:Sulfatase-modifying factor enzyme 1/Sulfatase